MKKILHIANWYPNQWNPYEALFIKEQFDSIIDNNQQLFHVQVRDNTALFRIQLGQYSERENYLLINTRISTWRIKELLTLCLLMCLRIQLGRKWWDIVNVHIAYPLLRFPRMFTLLFGRNVIITEHWSAYHQDFYLPNNSNAKKRIQKIFQSGFPVISVSQALMNDIIKFAETDRFQQHIIPNVVDPAIFHPGTHNKSNPAPVFLMAGAWAPIKRPMLIINAFKEILNIYSDARLRIIGYGEQWMDIKNFVKSNNLDSSINLLGKMPKKEIASELQQADYFVHASDYETFSVVCAEALCCGTPVIASRVGGIVEYINDHNGILVENSENAWIEAIKNTLQDKKTWDTKMISENAKNLFSPDIVGKKIRDALNQNHQPN